MNRKMVLYTLGQIIKLEAGLLLLPLAVALIYREDCAMAFALTALAAVVFGFGLTLLFKPHAYMIYVQEGFVIVAMSWLVLSAIGALPFVFSGEIPSYIDAFFETVSGFTTTGASILNDVESLSHGILFWRSFTHWIGGMGILVLMMALIPTTSGSTIHIMRAEMPGPIVGKLVPRIKDTAVILYVIYVFLTVLEVVFLLCGGMPFFDSVVHAFGTAGTGGFGIKADSIAGYSHYIQWVITGFMLLFGINFNLYYLLLMRKVRSVLKSEELWAYIGIFVIATAVIAANILHMCQGLSEALRLSAFQVASIVTTTGYATTNFDVWPQLSKAILLILMFVGSCAGSTAGGFKISRIILIFKMLRNHLRKLLHPRSVSTVRFEGKSVDAATQTSVTNYLALYIAFFAIIFLMLCFESFDFETNFSAAVSCFNNIGPGFGAVGPNVSYAGYSTVSKLVLSVAMLLGRLELYPLLLTFSVSTWLKK